MYFDRLLRLDFDQESYKRTRKRIECEQAAANCRTKSESRPMITHTHAHNSAVWVWLSSLCQTDRVFQSSRRKKERDRKMKRKKTVGLVCALRMLNVTMILVRRNEYSTNFFSISLFFSLCSTHSLMQCMNRVFFPARAPYLSHDNVQNDAKNIHFHKQFSEFFWSYSWNLEFSDVNFCINFFFLIHSDDVFVLL